MRTLLRRLGRLCISVALRAFPRRLRERYGDEPVRLFLARLDRRLEDDSLPAGFWMILTNAFDTLVAGVRARMEESGEGPFRMTRELVRQALRRLKRRPRWALLLAVPMALGLGAVFASFSIVDAVVIRPLPFPDSERVQLLGRMQGEPSRVGRISAANCADFAARLETPESVHCVLGGRLGWEGDDGLEMLSVARVSPGTLEMLGARALHGRTFLESDFRENGPVLLSHRAWQAHWGGDPSLVGTAVRLDGALREVIGILTPDTRLPEMLRTGGSAPELWVPLSEGRAFDEQTRAFAFGRAAVVLPENVSLAALADEVAAVGRGLVEEHPTSNSGRDGAGYTWGVESLRKATSRDAEDRILLLVAATILLLGIAVANSVNLVLVRTSERARELAVRMSLGASRRRVALELVVESVVVCLVAGATGVLLASWATDAFVALQRAGSDIPRLSEIALNTRVLLAGFGVALFSGLLVGALPGLVLLRQELGHGLRSRRSSATRAEGRVRGFFVAVQTAVALTLVANAALVMGSLSNLLTVDRGFDPEGLWVTEVEIPRTMSEDDGVTLQYFLELRERLAGVPGAQTASGSVFLHGKTGPMPVNLVRPGDSPVEAPTHVVLPDFFRTMEIPILEGRGLNETEHRPDGSRAIVLSRSLAEELFPEGQAVGSGVRVEQTDGEELWTVVGVAGDTRTSYRAAAPEKVLYMPFSEWSWFGAVAMIVRAEPGGGTGFRSLLPEVVRQADERVPRVSAFRLDRFLSDSAGEPRFYGWLLSTFSLVALVLAAIGLYATLSYAVARRTRELAIRMALGARAGGVVLATLRSALLATGLGCVMGIALALASGRLLEGLLFGITGTDPTILVLSVVTLLVVATLAAWAPGRRATRTDPMVALREE